MRPVGTDGGFSVGTPRGREHEEQTGLELNGSSSSPN